MIDKDIQIELRKKYNPEGSDLRKLQEHLLIILEHFDSFCKDNNINYWLSSGTCLGAIRHEGFIPWDDDIDVEMTREDYLKFQKIYKNSDKFVLQTYKNDLFYTEPFPKLRLCNTYVKEGNISALYKYNGIFLDIFIMERSNALIAKLCHGLVGALRHFGFCFRQSGVLSVVVFTVAKKLVFGIVNIMRRLGFLSSKDEMRHTIGTGVVRNIRRCKDIYPLSKALFEGREYPVPGNVDAYLSRMFGNYMEIPKEIHTHSLYNIKYYDSV